MRVLFSHIQGFGHFHPLVPLARALEEAGHEVSFATAARFCRWVDAAGFCSWPAGEDLGEVFERTAAESEGDVGGESDPWGFGARMFAGVAAETKVPDLLGIIDEWRPQVLIHDPVDFAGPVAAARAGLPYAVHSLGMLPPAEFWRRGAQLVAPTWRRWEVPPGELGGMFRFLCLDTCPPSLRLPSDFRAPNSRPLRPEAGDWVLGGELPAWTAHLPAQPTVYATLGTVDNEAPGVMETVLAALGGEEINVIATTGPSRDPAELGPQPSNVHVERYVTQSLLFPRCDAVVTHGGSGTLLTALGHGLPLLVLPQGANQFDNAERCVTAGAGIRLLPEELTPEAVLAGVRRLLDDQTYRRASARVAEEIRAMPGSDLAVRELEGMSEAGAAGIEAVGVRESGAE